MNIDSIIAGLILLVTGTILIGLSLVLAKKKIGSEDKYHTLFWIGSLCGLVGIWLLFGKLFI